jgi:hypothetical protein
VFAAKPNLDEGGHDTAVGVAEAVYGDGSAERLVDRLGSWSTMAMRLPRRRRNPFSLRPVRSVSPRRITSAPTRPG